MKQIYALLITASLVTIPPAAIAQDQGSSLMEKGAQMFLEGLLKEMEPALDDLSGLADDMGPALRNFTAEMGPALKDLLGQVEDWSAYEVPEILPNGDIIIRRKTDRPIEEASPPVDL